MHKSLHSSKRYCECSTTNKKTENEERMPTRKSEKTTRTISARGTSSHPAHKGGRKKRRVGRKATDETRTILTPEPSKNQVAFLTRNSVAIAPVVANCTKRCTRRKVIVNAHSTNRKPKSERKDANAKSRKLLRNNPRAARLLLSQSLWWKNWEHLLNCTGAGSIHFKINPRRHLQENSGCSKVIVGPVAPGRLARRSSDGPSPGGKP